MKKITMTLSIAAVFAMFCLMGCPTENDEGPKQDGPKLPEDWTGLDLVVVTGTNPGEIEYGFTATDPDAASYTVWCIMGSKNKAEEIEGVFGARSIPHTTAVQNQPISNLLPGSLYSIVVVAVKDGKKGYSAVRSARAKVLPQSTGYTLTVTGFPAATGGIYGAILTEPAAPDTPVAAAMGNSGKFEFYHYAEGSVPIDFNRPFVTPGIYVLAIVYTTITDPVNPEAIYMYTQNNGTVTYSDSNKDLTFAWSDFSDIAFVLTVSGAIPADILGAAVMDNLSETRTVLAVAVKKGGTFKFYKPDFTVPAVPIPSKIPWEGDGSYPLVLSTATQRYLYTAGKELSDPTALATKFDFTGSNGTASWSDFKQLPQLP